MQFISSDCLQLNKFYKENKDKARAKPSDLMFAAVDDEVTCAALRLLPYDNFLFLRSLLTHPSYRGQGIAERLIKYAIDTTLKSSASITIYTLPTPKAVSLYQRLGFVAIKGAEIPMPLQASYKRFRHVNNDSQVMVLQVSLG